MRPFRIHALTALLCVALMLLAAVPASADPGDGGATPSSSQSWHSAQSADPGDGGALADPGDGGATSSDPGDGGATSSDPGDGGGVGD